MGIPISGQIPVLGIRRAVSLVLQCIRLADFVRNSYALNQVTDSHKVNIIDLAAKGLIAAL